MAAPAPGGGFEYERVDSLVATIRALKASGVQDPLATMRVQLQARIRAGSDIEDARGALALIEALDELAESPPMDDA